MRMQWNATDSTVRSIRITRWSSQMFFEPGPVAEARRAQALPLIAQDPTRVPDHVVSGPELPVNETVRRRFFGRNREIPYSLQTLPPYLIPSRLLLETYES